MHPQDSMNVLNFGAAADGVTDDSAAIQRAIDAAAAHQGTVLIPPGQYAAASLRLRPHVGIMGYPTWSFREMGGSVLRLSDPTAQCLLDITGAFGSTVHGLCLDGQGKGQGVHGILIDKPDYGKEEDTPRLERCKVSRFTGDGVHFGRVWCFSVRHCMLDHNGGAGLSVRGWDGFVLDNWLSGNKGPGYLGDTENAAITFTGNRVEWNGGGGLRVVGRGSFNMFQITGNYFDRSGGPGIHFEGTHDRIPHVTITGNIIYRSGAPHGRALKDDESSHLILRHLAGLACTANTFRVNPDDGMKGLFSPQFGILYASLEDSVIKDNVLHKGALKQLLVDQGRHAAHVIVQDNLGSLHPPVAQSPGIT
ncbi:MAG: right-handed parallel beta-helix repeat-containing protein [Phycisphaeraceae bacterium]|nr:right-handed parallel beta-helix repeat-containing protein [Phycisphaeraceae bacterium]